MSEALFQSQMKELRESTGLNRKDFCEKFDIPYRTMTEWELGHRTAPPYVMRLLAYYIENEAKKNATQVNPTPDSAAGKPLKSVGQMDPREFLEILHVAERLKDTTRHCTTSKGRPESVAEHSWRISLMAMLLRTEFTEVDIDKVVNMCLIHDLGECFTGDIPAFLKTEKDRDVEDSLLDQWVKSLPVEVSEQLSTLYAEMNALETTEAKLYKALDKVEAVIQHNEAPIHTWAENEYEMNQTYAFDVVQFSEWLVKLRKCMVEDTLEKIEKEKDGGSACKKS